MVKILKKIANFLKKTEQSMAPWRLLKQNTKKAGCVTSLAVVIGQNEQRKIATFQSDLPTSLIKHQNVFHIGQFYWKRFSNFPMEKGATLFGENHFHSR